MIRVRMGVAFVGLALAVVAIARDDKRITWLAIAVLAVALALRFARRPPPPEAEEDTGSH